MRNQLEILFVCGMFICLILAIVTPFDSGSDKVTIHTTGSITFHVNNQTGNDKNNCLDVSKPCKTIYGALEKIPKDVTNPTSINVNVGHHELLQGSDIPKSSLVIKSDAGTILLDAVQFDDTSSLQVDIR